MVRWLRDNEIMVASLNTIDELDAVVHLFLDSPDERHLADTKRLAEKYSADAKAAWYVKIMEKMLQKGVSYAKDEADRVMKMLNMPLAYEKQIQLNDKLKILKVFARLEA